VRSVSICCLSSGCCWRGNVNDCLKIEKISNLSFNEYPVRDSQKRQGKSGSTHISSSPAIIAANYLYIILSYLNE